MTLVCKMVASLWGPEVISMQDGGICLGPEEMSMQTEVFRRYYAKGMTEKKCRICV